MQTFDVLILGAGQTGIRIANQLLQQKLNIALISLPGNNEDYLPRLISALATKSSSDILLTPDKDVTQIQASAFPQFLDERRVSVNGDEIYFQNAVLASGCGARLVANLENPITPVDLFQSSELPESITVWGAGAAGICTAMKAAQAGRRVRLISKHERVLPNEDEAMSDFVTQQLQKADVHISHANEPAASTDANIMCIGLKPQSHELNLPAAFIYADPATGRIKTDETMRTSNPHVFAVGAVTGPPFHLNFERFQADLVADNMSAAFFMKRRFMPETFPSLIPFSIPLARLGDTERDARKKFKDAEVVTKAIDNGFVKLIARKRSGLLVGAHVAGAGADGLILFFDLLMRAEIALRDVSERHHFPSSPLSNAAADAVESWIGLAGR